MKREVAREAGAASFARRAVAPNFLMSQRISRWVSVRGTPNSPPFSTGTGDGATGTGSRVRGTCRPGWLICIQSCAPWACAAAAQRAEYRAAKVGFGFQLFHLLPYLTVLDNVRVAATENRGADERARELIDRFGLTARLSRSRHRHRRQ